MSLLKACGVPLSHILQFLSDSEGSALLPKVNVFLPIARAKLCPRHQFIVLDKQCEYTISREAPIIGNATQSAEEPNQSWCPRKNRLEAGPTERQINWGHRQEYPHQQLNSPPRNQGTTDRRQSRQSTINNKIECTMVGRSTTEKAIS